MIDIVEYKDAILRYLIVKTEEEDSPDLGVVYSDIENQIKVPNRFIEEALKTLERDGFINNIKSYETGTHADIEMNCLAAYEFIGAGGYKAKQLIAQANLEKLDLELKKLAKELENPQLHNIAEITELVSNASVVISTVKSLFT